MGAGSRQFDPASGALVWDSSLGGIGKALGEFTTSTAAGSITDDRLLAGKPFVFPKTPFLGGTNRVFSFPGNQISWNAVASGGDPTSWVYGVGASSNPDYVSTHVPGTGGFRQHDDAGRFVIDETFFAYHFIGKVSQALNGGIEPFYVPYPHDNLPIFAIRGPLPVSTLGHGVAADGRNYVLLKSNGGANTVTLYFFGKVDPALSRGIGRRWWGNDGVLRGDTSIPPLNIVDTRVWGNLDWGGPPRQVPGTIAGRQYALMLHSPGNHYQSTGNTGMGPGNVTVSIAAGYITSSGGSDTAFVQEVVLSSNPGGGAASNYYVDGLYSLVDVTGM